MTAGRILSRVQKGGALPETISLRSLQIGRGIAASLVVLFHLNNSVWGIDKYFPQPFSPLLSFGNAGVQFFFVLSGFIIYLVHSADVGRSDRLKRFAWRRFIRVYPTYWIVLTAFIATLYLEPFLGTADERRIGTFIVSTFLAPLPVEPILSVAWTLKHEVMFYAIFGAVIVNARAGLCILAVWQMACLAALSIDTSSTPFSVMLSPNNLLFSIGLIAAYLFKTRRCPAPGWLAASGGLAFIAIGLHQVYVGDSTLSTRGYIVAYGLASGAIVLGACNYERDYGLRAPRWLDSLGGASYSIYLLHLPLLSVLAKLLFASTLAAWLPQPLSVILLLVAVLAIGIVFSRFVEMPLIAALNQVGPQRGRVVENFP